MNCPKCKSEMNMMFNMTVSMPSKYESKLTKKIMSSKEFKIWGCSWDKATYICQICGFTTKD